MVCGKCVGDPAGELGERVCLGVSVVVCLVPRGDGVKDVGGYPMAGVVPFSLRSGVAALSRDGGRFRCLGLGFGTHVGLVCGGFFLGAGCTESADPESGFSVLDGFPPVFTEITGSLV